MMIGKECGGGSGQGEPVRDRRADGRGQGVQRRREEADGALHLHAGLDALATTRKR